MYKIFKGKKVLVTGHTGFKGSWLSIWLLKMGASVIGVSLKNTKINSHFKYLKFSKKLKNNFVDIRDFAKIKNIIKKSKPDFIFHLAAQALVKIIQNTKIYF